MSSHPANWFGNHIEGGTHGIEDASSVQKHMQAQLRVLELLAARAPLREVLDVLICYIEDQAEGMLGSVMIYDATSRALHLAAAPHLPSEIVAACQNFPVGAGNCACGTAVYRSDVVISAEIATDPLWPEDYREIALRHGLRACWSQPFFDADGAVLGTLAMYYAEARAPSPAERDLINLAARLAGIAVQMHCTDEALREQAQHLELIFRQAAIGIVECDMQGRIVRANGKYCEMLMRSEAELIGHTIFDFAPALEQEVARETIAHQSCVGAWSESFDMSYVRPDATVVRTSVWASYLCDAQQRPIALVARFADVTEQREIEAALRLSEERFHLATAGSNDGIWDWDIEKGKMYYSPRLRHLLGYESLADFPGEGDSGWEQVHVIDRARVKHALGQHLKHGTPFDMDFRLRTRSGAYRWFRGRGQALWNSAGVATRMAGSISDVHGQKLAQQSLRNAQKRELRARRVFAQRLITIQEQERQRLASELHDSVGQNLSLIGNRAQLALANGPQPPAVAEHLKGIERMVVDTIEEVRTIAQNLRPLYIEQLGLASSLATMVEQVSDSSGLRIQASLEDVGDALSGPAATHLYRIAQEALNNVLKHARAQHVRIDLERDVHAVRLRVLDDGCGFEIALAGRTGGLGFTGMRERANMLGGSLAIVSAPGQGTTLKVELPIALT